MTREINTLIHDTNSELSLMSFWNKKLEAWLKENGKNLHELGVETSTPWIVCEHFKTRRANIMSIIDKYYISQKETKT